MRDEACVQFLQWALPQLQMRWSGFRKVRRQVCKRVQRRLRELGLDDLDQYRDYLQQHAGEWPLLDSLTRITISRFYRDKKVFQLLADEVLPILAQQALDEGRETLRIWSVGAGSGEEPYTLEIIWHLQQQSRFPDLCLQIAASECDPAMLKRARGACYSHGSLTDIPPAWRSEAFVRQGELSCLKPAYRQATQLRDEDIRQAMPPGPFDLILCRNLVFTYYTDALQRELLDQFRDRLATHGVLVIGIHEQLPAGMTGFRAWPEHGGIYQRVNTGTASI